MMIDNDNDMMLKSERLIFRLPFCLQVIDDIFTVLSLHFGVQCSLIVGLVFSSLHAADDADAHKKQFGDDE